MRISTSGAFQRGLSMMQTLQAALDRTQQQVSSGRALLAPSDDPIAAARAVELRESLSRITQFERNSEIAKNRLAHEETALVSVNDVLQRVRELALQANSDGQSNETRGLIAVELRERVDQLVQLANQRDGTGRYLFSGNRDASAPVEKNGGNFSYTGDQGQRLIQIGEDRQIPDGDSGASVFFMIKDGNGTFSTRAAPGNSGSGVLAADSVADTSQYDKGAYTIQFTATDSYEVRDGGGTLVSSSAFQPGDTVAFRGIEINIDGAPQAGDEFNIEPSRNQDVFSSIRDLADTLDTAVNDSATRADLHNGINASLRNIDQAIGQVLNVRTQVGTRLEAIDSQFDSNGAFALTLQETLSGIEDLDYAEALTRLTMQATTLEAAQQSFVRTQSLSLFSFL
jgi:flagellar hook-associated protein 3 FlgL